MDIEQGKNAKLETKENIYYAQITISYIKKYAITNLSIKHMVTNNKYKNDRNTDRDQH